MAWEGTKEEEDFEKAFHVYITNKISPSRDKIRKMQKQYPSLQRRTVGAIRARFAINYGI